mgnify:CR=1 FL=1
MKQFKEQMREIMSLAWQFVKRNGYTMSEALRVAWANFRLKLMMRQRIVRFWFQKVDGSLREAFGTLATGIIPTVAGADNRKRNDTVQTYYDTEKQEWRCYKKANLMRVS